MSFKKSLSALTPSSISVMDKLTRQSQLALDAFHKAMQDLEKINDIANAEIEARNQRIFDIQQEIATLDNLTSKNSNTIVKLRNIVE